MAMTAERICLRCSALILAQMSDCALVSSLVRVRVRVRVRARARARERVRGRVRVRVRARVRVRVRITGLEWRLG